MNAEAWVDGSFNAKTDTYGSGIILVMDDGHTVEQIESGDSEMYKSSRNVTGEVFAALSAVDIARRYKIKHLTIHYDYAGIEKWATGEWKANTELTKMYSGIMHQLYSIKYVDFVKVKAHSGILMNEWADELAKLACGLKEKNHDEQQNKSKI